MKFSVYVAIVAACLLAPDAGYAFGGANIDTTVKPVGRSSAARCTFGPYLNAADEEAQLTVLTPGPQTQSAGGNYYLGGAPTPWPSAITAANLMTVCEFSSVTNLVQNGADGASFATDAYIGVRFTAIANGETTPYDYEIALSGMSSTSLINTRTSAAPPNTPATAAAGPAQSVASAALITLDGSASSANDAGQSLTYAWAQTSGPAVTLAAATTASPSFTAPSLAIGDADAALTFQLIVNDGIADSAPDTVQITVTAPANTAATAEAGPAQSVASSALVTLDGSASSANDAGQSLTYAWAQTSGPAVTLAAATTASPSFTAPSLAIGDADAALTFELIVNDGIADSAPDTVQITVTAPANTAATAEAGPAQSVASAALVTLDGSASSANDAGQSLTYAWAQTSGPAVTLASATTASPSFTAPSLAIGDADAALTFQLIVNDGIADSAPDTVQITVTAPANTPATATAGPAQSVASAALVTLDGSASSANDAGQSLTYAWAQTSGPAVTLAAATTASPSFTAPSLAIGDADAALTFQLIVNDGIADSTPDTVQITVTAPANTAATAEAGPAQSVASSALVTLDGSASSANDAGQSLTYAWAQTSGPAVTLAAATTASPSFTAPSLAIGDADAPLTFELIVNDGIADSTPDTVQITVTAPANTAATAEAGPAQSVASAALVTLDGSASSANDAGQSLTYAWAQTSGPSVTLAAATTASPSFTAPSLAIGDADAALTFQLIVNDGIADSAPDTVQITVTAPLDITSPTVALSDLPDRYSVDTSFSVTVTFSEAVSGFSSEDISVTNATVTALSGTGAQYVALINPTNTFTINISIPAAVAHDAANNPNLASTMAAINPNTAPIAEKAIVEALSARGQALINAQPKLRGFLEGTGNSGLSAQVNRGLGQFTIGAGGTDARLWMRAQGQWSTTDTTSLDYYHLTIGGHIYRSDTLIFGAMAQTDSAKATLEAGDFKGRGWLAGPYVVARLPDQPIYFSASLLHGKTTNSLTLTGWPTDDFSSTRTLFTAGLEGRYTFESGLTLIPSFDVARLSEHQKSYTDSQNNVVRAQTIRQSNASLGLSFEKPLSLGHGDLLLTGGIAGVYSAQQAPGASRHSQHGRMELGALYAIDPMTSLSVSAHYDGIGDQSYEAFGGSLWFKMRF